MEDGILYNISKNIFPKRRQEWQNRIMLPKKFRYDVFKSYHCDKTTGHMGVGKTFDRISSKYYWKNYFEDIKNWVLKCDTCQSRKLKQNSNFGKLLSIPVTAPWEIVGIDVLGPLPPTKEGFRYILVLTDHFTKWPEAFSMVHADAETAARIFVNEIICRHGAPRKLISDRGTIFLSSLLTNICRILEIEKIANTAYNPQANGLTERYNKPLCDMMAMYTNKEGKNWNEYLPFALLALRTAIQNSTKETP
jgi:transposase InsO family protein